MKDCFLLRYCNNCPFLKGVSFKQHEDFQISLFISSIFWRRNFSMSNISLKFTRWSLVVVKSLIICCKICSLLVVEVALSKNNSFLVAKIHSSHFAKFARYSLQKLLVAKIHSLLVSKFTRCKRSLVTRCEICLLLAATNHLLLNVKNHSSLVKTITST